MKREVSDFIGSHRLMSPDGLHLVALSGGADSVALLCLLKELGYRVEAVHCNFRLRGDESTRDETFVTGLCHRLQVPLHLAHFDTREYAQLHQVSIEMAARELRYSYFAQLRHDLGAETVCVAHHRDDAVETLLMNLLRGSGIHGLTGIRPRNGHVVRPLLCQSREEIVAYLDSIGQTYVTDSTNLADDVLRNKLRLRVIPLLKELNPQAAHNIAQTATFLRQAERVVSSAMGDSITRLVKVSDVGSDVTSQSVAIPSLLSEPSPELFLHEWLSPYGFNTAQMAQISDGLCGGSGREYLSPSHILVVDRDRLVLEPVQPPMKPLLIPEPGRYCLTETVMVDVTLPADCSVSKAPNVATLDASQVVFPLTVRPVSVGDTFIPFGMKGHRLVSDFLTDRKLTLLEKRRQLVVTDARGLILWLVGLRTDQRAAVTTATTSVLRLHLLT